jgi:hypothetical protein
MVYGNAKDANNKILQSNIYQTAYQQEDIVLMV